MLQDIRANSQGTIAKIIIGLIVVSFSIFGIESLLFSGGSGGAAEVNGEEISTYALQQELSVQQRQLLAMLGENADPALLDQAQLSNQALQSLIQRELVSQAAESLRLTTSEQVLAEIITGMEQFQIDGVFSAAMYQSALASAGFTPALFRERLAEDLVVGQLRAGLAGSDFSTPSELELAVAIGREGRDLRYISLPLVDYLAEAEISDADIENYYSANPLEFQSQESVVLDYLELNVDAYRQPVDETLLREEFELVRDEFELSTETRVSHILLESRGQELESRLAEIETALAGGMSFDEAARTFSDDIGSAGAGGDLGFTAGDTFPEPMEEALAALEVGARSAPVRTDAGTHLLLVTDRREGTDVDFEDVRFELQERLQLAEAEAALLRDTERLRDLAFNAADLAAPAAELSMEVLRSDAITRQHSDGLFANPRLLQAAFSEDVLDAGHNSEVIELSPQQFVVLRVAERRVPELLPLADVRSGIAAQLRDASARASARAEASAMLEKLEAGSSVEETANEAGREWQVELAATRDSARLPQVLRSRLFSLEAPAAGEAVREIVDDNRGDIYLLEFVRATPGSLDALSPVQQQQWRQRVAGEAGGMLQQQFEAALRERADIVIY